MRDLLPNFDLPQVSFYQGSRLSSGAQLRQPLIACSSNVVPTSDSESITVVPLTTVVNLDPFVHPQTVVASTLAHPSRKRAHQVIRDEEKEEGKGNLFCTEPGTSSKFSPSWDPDINDQSQYARVARLLLGGFILPRDKEYLDLEYLSTTEQFDETCVSLMKVIPDLQIFKDISTNNYENFK
ncbi:hypothetical protein ACH5RR_009028 [Cinchona calisaya]|uniref:Uncharacterized protein n=1 Tax=Cinchona calisaya TaxID=153742 RepID=A0ABD3AFH5_9GENT